MKAGYELDILIAEKVMGLKVIKTEWNKGKCKVYSIGEPDWQDYSGEMILANPLPNYSEDIKEAMEVFDKLRNSHEYCCLKISSDYNYIWTVSLTKAQPWPNQATHNRDEYKHQPSISINEESLPLAICLTALETVK